MEQKSEEETEETFSDEYKKAYDETNETFSDGYKKAYDELIEQGYPKRKARRYLDSIAKRNLKKIMKKIKKSGKSNTISTEPDLIDNETNL